MLKCKLTGEPPEQLSFGCKVLRSQICASVVMDAPGLVIKWDSFEVLAVVAVVMFVSVLTYLNVVHFSVLVPDCGLLTTTLMFFDVFVDFESVLLHKQALSYTTETRLLAIRIKIVKYFLFLHLLAPRTAVKLF